jgi:hypothetical protein
MIFLNGTFFILVVILRYFGSSSLPCWIFVSGMLRYKALRWDLIERRSTKMNYQNYTACLEGGDCLMWEYYKVRPKSAA